MPEDRVKNSKVKDVSPDQANARKTPVRKVKRGPATHREPIIKTRDRGEDIGSEPDNGLTYRSMGIEKRFINEKKRTIELSFSSETANVMTWDWDLGGAVPEVLSHGEGAVDLGPLVEAGSVLNNHRSDEPVAIPLDVSIDTEGRKGRATIHFPEGDPDSERAWNRVLKGLIRGVSVGYSIGAVEKIKSGQTSAAGVPGPAVVATRWTVHEISLTAVPADSSVGVGRHKQGATPTTAQEVRKMNPIKVACRAAGLDDAFAEKLIAEGLDWERDEKKIVARIQAEVKARSRKPKKPTRARRNEEEEEDGREEEEEDGREEEEEDGREEEEEEGRSRKPKKRSRAPSAGQLIRAERKREREIRNRCRAAGLDDDFADRLVDDGVDIDVAARKILDEMARTDVAPASRGGRGTGVQFGADATDKHLRFLQVNLERRALSGVGNGFEETEQTRTVEQGYMTLQDCVRSYLEILDIPNARWMSPSQLWRSYLNPSTRLLAREKFRAAGNTSGDLANVLSNLQGKSLMMGFASVKQTWRYWARKGNLKDFKPSPATQLTDFANFRETLENGEILDSKLDDRQEIRQLAIYGRAISLTLQMFINDDLDALGRLPAYIGKSAADLPDRLAYTHLLANPQMSDGNNYFDNTNHGNFPAGTDTLIDASNKVTALSKGLQSFRKMTGPSAPNDTEFPARNISIEPKILLLPPELEYHGRSLVNPNLFQADSGAGMFAGKFEPVVESKLSHASFTGYSDKASYLAAAAGEADTAEVSFLDGNEAPIIDTFDDPNALAVKTRAWMACGAKMLDWRSMVKMKGEA